MTPRRWSARARTSRRATPSCSASSCASAGGTIQNSFDPAARGRTLADRRTPIAKARKEAAMTVIWQPALSDEAAHWRAVADRLTQARFAPLAEELDREQRYPWENVRALVEHKLAGLFIPKQYGGEGASLSATAAVVEGIAA